MAFNKANLNPVGGQSRVCTQLTAGDLGNGAPAVWSYVTEDTLATVDTAGYFDNGSTTNTGMRSILNVGDIILVTVVASGVMSETGMLVVLTNASGVIDTADASIVSAGGNKHYIAVTIEDISAAADEVYIPCPVAGTISEIRAIINNAITVADNTLTGKINGTAITGGTLTLAYSGSAAGDAFASAGITAANTVAVGDSIEVETDGGSTTACKCTILIEITPSVLDTD